MSTIMSDDNSSIAISDLARECGFNFGNDFTSFDRSAIASVVEGIHDRLHQLALSSNGFEKLDFIFDVTDYHAVNSQLADWSENIFPVMPIIEILDDATMRGALGAYSGEQNTIYLARSLVQRDGLTGLTQVMLEEYGHYLDQQFNPGGDTAGDEGELFRLTVLGEAIDSADLARLRADNDWGTLNFDDTSTLVEFDNSIGTARNIGSLTTAQTFQGFVGSNDTNDYYRFSIAQNASPFTLTLNGLSADADVQLLNNSGGVITSSARGGTVSESINRTLNAGIYYVRVYPYGGANTNYALTLSADWYGPNLHDAGITNLARQLSADGNLNRNDMILILRNAEDGNLIDATEVADLRTLVSGRRVLMPGFVYNLTNKIVNGHEANRWWTGGSTSRQLLAPISPSQNGNLYAGATVSHMERLIGKWFLGLDRPAIRAGEQYRPVNGSLFRNGIQYQDVDQGGLGDCYLCAALAGAAFRNPTRIQNMFIDNGDGTYTVRFFNNGVADYVTVDRYLPTNNFGGSIYMGWGGGLNTATTNELWTGLAERAYAQMSESAWINRSSTNSYATISGGWPDTALNQITAQGTVRDLTLTNSDRTSIINQFNAGRTVFLNWATHALTMVGYNSATQLFRIYNPHGNEYNLTWQQILNGGNGSARYTDWSYSTTS